ncbi:hypothetical protein ACN28S_09750 [Cystobacter fuscus]
MRLLIERVVVTGAHVTIEHAVLLSGRFCRLRKNDAIPSWLIPREAGRGFAARAA